ncbi:MULTISPECIES: hypothetical protein [unclassified Bradyrhizobium]|uniref:hypothetical protein n=1 Tax=unclassified Bradyrhizobium TaxID=2631580 RepID=UPI0024E079B4|nr:MULTISPECIES: hypothetical protein [unclassified Bradyrhizobium]
MINGRNRPIVAARRSISIIVQADVVNTIPINSNLIEPSLIKQIPLPLRPDVQG